MDKTEITQLPERMSSEEIDALTTGEEVQSDTLAQEALDATEGETPPAEESAQEKVDETESEQPPEKETEKEPELSEHDQQLRAKDSKIASLKHSNRDSEIRAARLQGELDARKSIQAQPKEKSPLEIAMEAEGVNDPDELEKPFSVMQKQIEWQKEQDGIKTADTEQTRAKTEMDQSVNELQSDELSTEKVGEGLDFKTVIALGEGYLDQADLLKIDLINKKDGVKAGLQRAYKLCKQGILDAGNEDSKLLQIAINLKAKRKTQTKPKKQPTDIDALTTEGEDEDTGEAETETHNSRLTDFIFDADR